MRYSHIVGIIIVVLGLVFLSGPVQAVVESQTLVVQSSDDDAWNKLYNGAVSTASPSIYVGAGSLAGWRFENLPVPPGSEVIRAVLRIFCYTRGGNPISIRYTAEAGDDAKAFSTEPYNLMYRPKTSASVVDAPGPWNVMGWNESPDLAAIIQEVIDRPGWRVGNAVAIFADGEASSDYRTVLMMEKGYAARLDITYTINKIEFDTNHDGIIDISMKDTDGDGYFECPVGKTEYSGTLIIDKPIEIMGSPATRTETLFKGDEFILTDGAKVISDLTSPVVSSAYPGLKGNDFQVVARDFIWIQYGAEILLGGDSNGDFGGDIYLETTRPGADVIVKESAFINGRHIDMISNGGAISLRTNTVLIGTSHMKFRAEEGGDIHLNRDVSLSTSSPDGDCWITFITKDGDVHMNRNIDISADVIDMCGVIKGNIWDDGTVTVTGKTQCWGD